MAKRKRANGLGDVAQQHASGPSVAPLPPGNIGSTSSGPHGTCTAIDWNTQAIAATQTPTSPTATTVQPIAQSDRTMLSPSTSSFQPATSTSGPSSSSSLEAELAKVSICPICLSPFDERVYLSPCFHSYCAACLDAWVAVSVSCPLCKTRPDKLHHGVDTTRRLLQTIYILQPVAASSTPSWQDQLHRLAHQGQHASTPTTFTATPSSLTSSSPSSSSLSPEADLAWTATASYGAEDELMQQDLPQRSRSPTPIDTISISTFDYDTQPFFVSPRRPAPVAGDSSLSTSFQAAAASMAPASMPPQPQESIITVSSTTIITTPPPVLRPPRIDVYMHNLLPTPASNYPRAAQIHVRDLPLLRPFLERDLAVLTETYPAPSPVLLSHIENVLCSVVQAAPSSTRQRRQQQTYHARAAATNTTTAADSDSNEAQWCQVQDQIAEWITFSTSTSSTTTTNHNTLYTTTVAPPPSSVSSSFSSPLSPSSTSSSPSSRQLTREAMGNGGCTPRTPHSLAQQFVDEMRRVARRRLAVRPWDAQVLYQSTP
ncbi:hypothetical protein DFQ26_003957 [Actinomortierella ambigua]|nr:hypothetical protein DFQ26_003957 [Actinomortierella ambigua]